MKKIACVIVTYNRKELLKRCLEAVSTQTYKPNVVYIIDNASTDGTIDSVKDWGYYEREKDGIHFKYIMSDKNTGGAGGFYLGMKTAIEDDFYDGIWVMDDDGVPTTNCLDILKDYLATSDFISPLVMSITDTEKSAFGNSRYNEIIKMATNDIINNRANLFNGVLLSRRLIQKVGYPRKEMFIWGDEMNYEYRCVNNGFIPITCIKAIHYHPDNRQQRVETFFNKQITITDAGWKLYYLIRNQSYNALYEAPGSKMRHILGVIYSSLHYIYFYMKNRDYYKLRITLKAYNAALRKDFRYYEDVFR